MEVTQCASANNINGGLQAFANYDGKLFHAGQMGARVLRPELAITPDGDVRRRTVANCANGPTMRRQSPTVVTVRRRSLAPLTVADG